jgi:hypothetical protein
MTMMTMLLWRCPVCGTDDALDYRVRWFRPDHLHCSHCGALWEVRRVIGEDYRLRVVAGDTAPVGLELPLAEWYDRMKEGFRLEPLAVQLSQLGSDEVLYLQGVDVPLIVRTGNPLLTGWEGRQAPTGPLPQELAPQWDTVGVGRLLFTNQRLIWAGDQAACDFWWNQVNAVFTWFVEIFGIMYGTTTYRFEIPGQSILKWLTYSGFLAQDIEAATGRSITVSHY